jgi:hypothetical protein
VSDWGAWCSHKAALLKSVFFAPEVSGQLDDEKQARQLAAAEAEAR